ncbi:MAG: polysaccharide biosynthesis protein [Spirochaetaceae bacterium]|nr:polysaccharide biosynthesis protein [Spirochaetaceae bacterium]HPE88748.1 nucleoside-diphosphate sugar epimerase/dehydratase [Spirochaetales bacterium]
MESSPDNPRIYIVGAGFAGRAIAREIRAKAVLGTIVAFLDDDEGKLGKRIDGVPVLGPIRDVVRLLAREPADEAIIAMPSAPRELLRELYFTLKRAGFARIRILPDVAQIVEGDAHLVQAREIDPQDLLGRSPVAIGLKKSIEWLAGKRVIVTGAGGSIGSELARQLLSAGVERLYLFGHGENSIYQIDRELRGLQSGGVGVSTAIVPVIGELKDRDYMTDICRRLKADVVFHAAAYKHVPMMEANTVAAIENNAFGTRNLVDACLAAGVRRFVLISTDKAVEPLCVYGASKFLSERIVLDAQERAGAGEHYMVVRFGNVLGSRGSILPLFKGQVERGGPVTVTDPAASRYFMTIPEACSLVLKTGGVGAGGESYLLDMGEPVLIRELAEQVIRFSGLRPYDDIAIEYIGLRPGERLEERLFSSDESLAATEFPKINRLERRGPRFDLEAAMRALEPVCFKSDGWPDAYRNRRRLRAALRSFIPTVEEHPDEPEY